MSELTSDLAGRLTAELESLGTPRELAGELIAYLGSAISLSRTDLFGSYVRWRAGLDTARGVRTDLLRALANLHDFADRVPGPLSKEWNNSIDAGLAAASERAEPVDDGEAVGDVASQYLAALLSGDRRKATDLVMNALEEGMSIRELYLNLFRPALVEVGHRWERNELTVGQEHYCTAVTQSIMAQLYPRIFSDERKGLRFVATCVEGNLHEIGVRMVADLLELDGWDTYYLGANTPNESVVDAVEEQDAHVLGLSVMLSAQVPAAAETIRAVRASKSRGRIQILVGGRGFSGSAELAMAIGADAWLGSADDCVNVANRLVNRG